MFYSIASFCTYRSVEVNDKDKIESTKLSKAPPIVGFLDGVIGIALLVIGGLAASGCCFPHLNAPTTIYAFLAAGTIEGMMLFQAVMLKGTEWSSQHPVKSLIQSFKEKFTQKV